jgi:hypothetical protein
MEIVSQNETAHHVEYNKVDGVVKVAAYSFDGASSGNNAFKATGDMLVITVAVDANYTPAEVGISDIKFVTWEDLALVETFTVVNEQGEEVLMGDVDGDGQVKVLDAMAIIDYFLKKKPEPFNAAVADMDGDGEIKVLDAMAVIDIYLKNN